MADETAEPVGDDHGGCGGCCDCGGGVGIGGAAEAPPPKSIAEENGDSVGRSGPPNSMAEENGEAAGAAGGLGAPAGLGGLPGLGGVRPKWTADSDGGA